MPTSAGSCGVAADLDTQHGGGVHGAVPATREFPRVPAGASAARTMQPVGAHQSTQSMLFVASGHALSGAYPVRTFYLCGPYVAECGPRLRRPRPPCHGQTGAFAVVPRG